MEDPDNDDDDDGPGIKFAAADIGDLLINELRTLDKTLHNVDYLCGDNCPVNRKLAEISDLPFIGCASHRLNLAIEFFCKDCQ